MFGRKFWTTVIIDVLLTICFVITVFCGIAESETFEIYAFCITGNQTFFVLGNVGEHHVRGKVEIAKNGNNK